MYTNWDSCNFQNSNLGWSDLGFVEQFWGNLESGSMSNADNLVFNGEKVETMEVLDEKKDGALEVKSMTALKSHSEAEKRRRERINAHLDTLRGLVPCNGKLVLECICILPDDCKSALKDMDKASLLAEVISQVKQLKNSATEASKGLLIPMDADEVKVDLLNCSLEDRTYFSASICCDYKREVISDVKQALDSLHLNILKSEISTFKKRMKYVIVFTGVKENSNAKEQQLLLNAVRQTLSSILEKISLCTEYSPRTMHPNKRRKKSIYETSSLSS